MSNGRIEAERLNPHSTESSLGMISNPRFDRRREDTKCVSTFASVILSSLVVVGCGESSLIGRSGPTDAEALVAIQTAMSLGARMVDLQLPAGVKIVNAKVGSCVDAAPQKGHRCNVAVATPDIPIIGGIAAEVVLRFSKEQDGRWVVFML